MDLQAKRGYWWIIILLLIATSLSFLDRQVLSITILKIKDDIPINDVEYGLINSGFLISYAIMFTLGGILIDRYGSPPLYSKKVSVRLNGRKIDIPDTNNDDFVLLGNYLSGDYVLEINLQKL